MNHRLCLTVAGIERLGVGQQAEAMQPERRYENDLPIRAAALRSGQRPR
jgi:hypothetical protein